MQKQTRNKWILIVAVILVSLIVLGFVLIILRGEEDTWIKDADGNWIKHGNPSSSAPPN